MNLRKVTKNIKSIFNRATSFIGSRFVVGKNKSGSGGGIVRTESESKKIIKMLEAEKSQLDKQIETIQKSTRTSIRQLSPIHNYLRQKSKLYYLWHLNPFSKWVHLLSIAIFVIVSASTYHFSYYPLLSRAIAVRDESNIETTEGIAQISTTGTAPELIEAIPSSPNAKVEIKKELLISSFSNNETSDAKVDLNTVDSKGKAQTLSFSYIEDSTTTVSMRDSLLASIDPIQYIDDSNIDNEESSSIFSTATAHAEEPETAEPSTPASPPSTPDQPEASAPTPPAKPSSPTTAKAVEVKQDDLDPDKVTLKINNNISLNYKTEERRLKEAVVINTKESFTNPDNPQIKFALSGPYKYVTNPDNSVSVYQDNDQYNARAIFSILPPTLIDSANQSGNITQEVTETNGVNYLIIKPDPTFISTATFPITIDPTVTISTSTTSTPLSYSKDRTLWEASSGTLVSVYHDGSDIVFRTSTDQGDTWSAGATTIGGGATSDDNGFSTFMDSANHIYITYTSNGTNDYVFYRKLTYSTGPETWTVEAEKTVESAGTSQAYPSITSDSSGDEWVTYRYYDGANYTIRVKTTVDDGDNWSASTTLSSTTADANTYPSIILWNSEPTVIYNYANTEIRWNYFNGTIWQSSGWGDETVSSQPYATMGMNFSVLETSDNYLHLAWKSSVSAQLKYKYNSNGVANWQTDNDAYTYGYGNYYPSIGKSVDDDLRVYFQWSNQTYYTEKLQGSSTWARTQIGTSNDDTYQSAMQTTSGLPYSMNSWVKGTGSPYDIKYGPTPTGDYRYWISDIEEDWNDTANWSASSGGASGASVPSTNDVVIFDSEGTGNCNLDTAPTVAEMYSTDYAATFAAGANVLTVSGIFSWNSGTYNGGTVANNFNGDWFLTGGTYNATSGIMTLGGGDDFTHTSGGTFNHSSGTVTFTGSTSIINVDTTETFNDLTVDTGAATWYLTISSGDILVVNGTLTLSDGKVQTGTIDLNGTLASTSDFDGGNATILIDGGLTVNISDGWILPGINLDNGTLNAPAAGTMTFAAGSFTVGVSGTFNHNSGTVAFTENGSTVNVDTTETFNNLTVDKGSATWYLTISSGDTLVVGGTLTLTRGKIQTGTIDLNGTLAGASTFSGGSAAILINDGQTVNVSDGWVLPSINLDNGTLNAPSEGTMTFSAGSFTVGASGTFNHNSGTVAFTENDATVNVDTTETFNNLTLNKAAPSWELTISSGDTLVVNGTLTLTDGKLYDLGIIDVKGDVTVASTFDGGDGIITLSGTQNQTYTVASGGVVPTGDLTINKTSGTAYITGTGTFHNINLTDGTLEFAEGGTYTIDDADAITTSTGTDIRFNGSSGNLVTLRSDAAAVWDLTVPADASYYANYVDVEYSSASRTINALNSTCGTGVVNWDCVSLSAKTWDGGAATTVWNDDNNWNPDGAPTYYDTTTLDVLDTITTNANINFGSLQVGGTNDTVLQLSNDIDQGGPLTIKDGSTLQQENITEHSLDGNLIIEANATLTHKENGTTGQGEMYKVNFQVNGDITVTGSINADAKGYEGGQGPGSGSSAMGAVHGGRGNNNSKSPYGSMTNPTTLGSGSYGGASVGGGAIIINSSGTMTVAGTLSADGYDSNYGPSGGSVNVSAGTLAGGGGISAEGGDNNNVGGGGGRIGLNGVTTDNFTGTVSANGGELSGFAGTIYFNSQKRTNWTIASGQTYRLGTDITNGSYTFGTITIEDGGTLEIESDEYMNSNEGGAATINVTTLDVQVNGHLSADYLGFTPSDGPAGGTSTAGGGHGGRGLDNSDYSYGSMTNPITIGSGGYYRYGGGALLLNASSSITVNGTISALGQDAPNGASAGGSINITTPTLNGSGTISAAGGTAPNSGGGGRIGLGGVTTDSFSGTLSVGSDSGGAGTIYLNAAKRTSWTIASGQTYRLGTSVHTGDSVDDYTFGTITIQSGGTLEIDGDEFLNSNEGGAATINATSIDVQTGGKISADYLGFVKVSGPAPGGLYIGANHGGVGMDNANPTYGDQSNPVTMGSGAYYTEGGGVIILNVSGTLQVGGTITADGETVSNGSAAGGTVNIAANSVTVDATGIIRANGGAGGNQGAAGRVAVRSYGAYTNSGTIEAVSGGGTAEHGSVYINTSPAASTLSTPTDTATEQSQLTAFTLSTTDATNCLEAGGAASTGTCTPNQGDYLRYKLDLDTVNTFDSGDLQTFDQTSSQTGWSDQDAETNTAYASGTVATYTIQSALDQGDTYYWRVYAIDQGGIDSWDGSPHWSTVSSTYSFTVAAIDKTTFTAGTAQTINTVDHDTCSTILTFETRNSLSETVPVLADTTFDLSDGGASGTFYSASNCTSSITTRVITTGNSNASFYYANTTSSESTYDITISENPSQSWTDATTTIQVNPGYLDHFTMTGYNTTYTADDQFNITVTAYDSLNNVKFDYYGAEALLWFSASANAELPYTSSSKYTMLQGDSGIKQFTNFRLQVTGNQTITLHHSAFTSDSITEDQLSISTSSITVNPGVTDEFYLTDYPRALPPTYTKYAISGNQWSLASGASENFDMIVTVRDQFDNIKTDYNGSIYFSLYLAGGSEAPDYNFTWNSGNQLPYDPGTDAGVKQTNGIAGNYSYFVSTTSGKTLDLRISDGSVTTQGVYTTYIKPLGLDYFTISTSSSLMRDSVVNDQDVDEEWDNNDTPVSVTVTAYDTLTNVKVDYGYAAGTGEGRVYFYSPQRETHSSGTPVTNKEFPYYKTSSTDTTGCFEMPIASAGVHTFVEEDELFKFFKGGRRTVYVSECITPTDTYSVDNDLKDPNFSDGDWDSREFNTKTGILPASSTIAVESHVPGSTHTNDAHSDDTNTNVTIGPGDEKLTLNWQNPFDTPMAMDPKVYIYQCQGVTLDCDEDGEYSLLDTPRPLANGAGTWQSQDITGLTNDLPYWFMLKSAFKRSVGTYILSDYSNKITSTPKAIAPLNVTVSQLDRDDPTYPGQLYLTYSLRFDSTTTFSYFNPSDLNWYLISDSAVSGDKGLLDGDFGSPIAHTTYIDMNADFDGQYLSGSFKVRVNVDVSGQGSSNSESNLITLDTKNPNNTTLVVDATSDTTADLTITAADDSGPIKMIISIQSDFSDATFEDYATTKTDFDITGATTVYIKFRDLYYNDTSVSTSLISALSNFGIKDASTITSAQYRLVIIWDSKAGTDHYNVWRTTNGVDYSKIDEATKNIYGDPGLNSTITYGYKVTSEDALGNISLPAGPVSSMPGAAPDVTADPEVELFGWLQDFGVRAKVTWNTDQLADSNVAYSTGTLNPGSDMTTVGGEDVLIAAEPDLINSHEVWLHNLEPSTTYTFKAFSKNEIQIAGYSNVISFTTPEKIPLLITGMTMTDVTMDSALIDWDTSKLSTTVLEYGSSSSYGTTIVDTNFNTDHTFKLENLDSGTQYYLRASATDPDGNVTVSDQYIFSTPAMPIITNVTVAEVSFSTATITWNTNENTDSFVQFGLGSLTGTQGAADSTTKHSATIIGLEARTTYSFRAMSKDKFGNVAKSDTKTFTTSSDTQAPVIEDVKSEVTSTGAGDAVKYQAVISWNTDEPATSQIEYSQGITGEYSDSTELDESLNSTHVVIIPDLNPNSAYHFQIRSQDKVGNEAVSEDISLITPPKEKSLLQIVIQSLEETFSWVGRLRDKWFGGEEE